MNLMLFRPRRRRCLEGVRPSKRIPFRIRFRVTGKDENGFSFEDYVETIDLSAGGGCLAFNKDVKKGDNLRLYGPKGTSFTVIVRWFRYDMKKNSRSLGFQLLEPEGSWIFENGSK
jgi:hypothetical protein